MEGIDTAHKLTILMSLAYGARLDLESIAVEGISRLDPLDLQFAREFGYRLKLLAITRDDGHRVEARVHPTLIPKNHMLSQRQRGHERGLPDRRRRRARSCCTARAPA